MSQSEFLAEMERRIADWESAEDPTLPMYGLHTTRSLMAQKWIDGQGGFDALARLLRIVKRLRVEVERLSEDSSWHGGCMADPAVMEYDGQEEGS